MWRIKQIPSKYTTDQEYTKDIFHYQLLAERRAKRLNAYSLLHKTGTVYTAVCACCDKQKCEKMEGNITKKLLTKSE